MNNQRYAVAREIDRENIIIREFDSYQDAENWFNYAINTDAYGYGILKIISID